MRMNISVPDSLAEEARRRKVPISAVCQQALRDEVTRLRETEDLNAAAREHAIQVVMAAAERDGETIDRDSVSRIARLVLDFQAAYLAIPAARPRCGK